MDSTNLTVDSIPVRHIVAGYVLTLKVLDEDGNMYWATRLKDVNDMEAYGMAMDMVETIRVDLQNSKEDVGDE